MSKLRALIADDEELGRMAVRLLLERDERFHIVAEVGNGEAALAAMAEQEIDVAFLDIHMPGLDGLEVAARLDEDEPFIVFVTAHEEHAVQAFREAAVDYLVKPIDPARFREAADRVERRAQEREASSLGDGNAESRITLSQGNRRVRIAPRDIVTLEASGNYVLLHEAGQTEPHRFRRTMKAILDEIAHPSLMRVHRAFAVNLDQVRELRSTDGAHALSCEMSEGPAIPVGRTYRADLRRRLDS